VTGLLAGDRPIFLLHRSHQGGADFGPLAEAVANAAGPDVELGAIVNLPRQTATEARAILDSAGGFDLRIADPEFHDHQAFGGTPSARRRERAPYLVGSLPRRPSDEVIDTVLRVQREAGATALLTPTGAVSTVEPERTLADAIRWVAATRAKAPTEPLVVSLTLSRSWLTEPRLREVLLNEIVDSTERNWYLRVRWDPLRPRHVQLADTVLLGGYAHVAEVLSSEQKILLLPQTGLTGWLMTGLGAAGFSVGTGGPEQAFAETVQIRIRGPRRPPVPRYFEPTLLHTVTAATQSTLSSSASYSQCLCGYCSRMRSGSAAIDPARWERDLAARHFVVSLAALQARLAGRDRQSAARRVVAAARSVENSAAPRLTGEDRPAHLAVWEDLLTP
jgi:hypothetical protein